MPGELKGLSNLIATRFIQRRDVKAKQLTSGAYTPVRSRFTQRDLEYHLRGKATYGHYVVDSAGKCRCLAFDIDFDDIFLWEDQELNPREIFGTDHPARPALNGEIRSIADGLAWRLHRLYPKLIISTAFSGSKGIHVYGSFPQVATAAAARKMALDVLDSFDCFKLVKGKNFYKHTFRAPAITIEVYPKQEKVGKGFGNLLRLPLGVNQKTNRQGFFYNPADEVHELRPCDPAMALWQGVISSART